MPAGEAFSARQREDIERAVGFARSQGGFEVSVYVGSIEEPSRRRAERLHATLPDAADSVLVAVDPAQRRLEIVTGPGVRGRLDDRSCGFAAVSMTSAFGAGDLSGGIVNGLQLLAEHARRPPVLHTDDV